MPLNYTNSIPLHFQLQEEIQAKIAEGHYTEKIPSERELMEEYYVSRSTVRQAVSQLVQNQVLEKKAGRGTFIAAKPINDWLGSLKTTAETIESMDMSSSIKLIQAEIVTLSGMLREITGLKQAYHFVRLRYANQIPLGIERHYYPVPLGEKLAAFDLHQASFYNLLEKELGIRAIEADQNITADKPSSEDAALLNIPASDSVLHAERFISDVSGEFIELEKAYYRADMYTFKIKLSRKS